MRLFTVLVAVSALLISSACLKSKSEQQPSAKIDPTGYFTIKGKAPRELSEIDWIAINPENPKPEVAPDSNWGSKFPHGCLRLKNGTRIKYDQFLIRGNSLELRTAPNKGTTYSFKGQFGPEKAFDDVQKDLSALTGTMTKTSNGATTQFGIEFFWFNGD